MAATSKPAGRKSKPAETISFAEALKKLESVVEAMEEGDLPLETLLEKYEEGTQLVKACQDKLADAELKIKKLEETTEGEAALTSLALEAEAAEDDR